MQICISPQTHNHASTAPLFYRLDALPAGHATNSVKALKESLGITTKLPYPKLAIGTIDIF